MEFNTNSRVCRSRLESGSDVINDSKMFDKNPETDCQQCLSLEENASKLDSVGGRKNMCWKCTRMELQNKKSSCEDKIEKKYENPSRHDGLNACQERFEVKRKVRATSNIEQKTTKHDDLDTHRRKSDRIEQVRLARSDTLSEKPLRMAPNAIKDGDITVYCNRHAGKISEYYCTYHDEILCSVCMSLSHNECINKKHVEYIPDYISIADTEQDLKDTFTQISDLSKLCQDKKDKTTKLLTRVINMYTKIEDDIKDFRKQINERLDQVENGLLNEMKNLRDNHTNSLVKVFEQLEETLKTFKHLNFELLKSKQSQNVSQRFAMIKKTVDEIKRQKRESGIENKTGQIDEYFFEPNEKLKVLLNSVLEFGNLRVRQQLKHVQLQCAGTINVRSKDDKKIPWITSLVFLSDSFLVVTDYDNHLLKLIDINKDLILSVLRVPSTPHAVTKVSSNQVAVTLPDRKKVLFVSLDDGELCFERSLQVKGRCYGIAALSSAKQIILTLQEPPRVCIICYDGSVVREIVNDMHETVQFSCPEYVSVSTNGERIYVSDYDLDSLAMLDKYGKVLKVFKNPEERDKIVEGPKTVVAAQDGYVYLCGGDSNNVIMLTNDCEKYQVVLKPSDGLHHPVCFGIVRQSDNTFVYVNAGEHTLKIFRF